MSGQRSSPYHYYLSEEERKSFDENGYIVIKGLVDVATLDRLKQRFDDVCNKKVPGTEIAIIRDLKLFDKSKRPEEYVNKLNYVAYDPVFAEYSEHPRMVHVVEQLLGNSLAVMNSMMINKPPGSPWHPPHQDVFSIPIEPIDRTITSWTAIEPVTADNGCLFVVPGSHKQGIYEEVHLPNFINNLYFMIPDVDAAAPESRRVRLAPMEPGDTAIFSSLLVHGSFPNKSQIFRKAITSVYADSTCQLINDIDPVRQTFQTEILKVLHSHGLEGIKIADYWRMRSKQIKGLKSNL